MSTTTRELLSAGSAAIDEAARARQRAIVERLRSLGSPASHRMAEVMERILAKLDQRRSMGDVVSDWHVTLIWLAGTKQQPGRDWDRERG